MRDSKLETEVSADHSVEVDYVSDLAARKRRNRVEQRWQVTGEMGRGSFGIVQLEEHVPFGTLCVASIGASFRSGLDPPKCWPGR